MPARRAWEEAALAAIGKWEFRPAVQPYSSSPIPTLVLIRIDIARGPRDGAPPRVDARMRTVDLAPLREPAKLAPGLVIHDPGAGVQDPVPIRSTVPYYTQAAMRSLRQGVVQIEAIVMPDGTVGSTRVVKGLDRDLDRVALIAGRYWLFEPARRDGAPIPIRVVIELEFRLH
jgi:TonB family protein